MESNLERDPRSAGPQPGVRGSPQHPLCPGWWAHRRQARLPLSPPLPPSIPLRPLFALHPTPSPLQGPAPHPGPSPESSPGLLPGQLPEAQAGAMRCLEASKPLVSRPAAPSPSLPSRVGDPPRPTLGAGGQAARRPQPEYGRPDLPPVPGAEPEDVGSPWLRALPAVLCLPGSEPACLPHGGWGSLMLPSPPEQTQEGRAQPPREVFLLRLISLGPEVWHLRPEAGGRQVAGAWGPEVLEFLQPRPRGVVQRPRGRGCAGAGQVMVRRRGAGRRRPGKSDARRWCRATSRDPGGQGLGLRPAP